MSLASTAVARSLLQRAYAANKLPHVAYIDESYLLPSNRFAQTPFYVVTAYIAPCADLNFIRSDLQKIVGGTYWHTTDAHRDEARRPVIEELCRYIGEGKDDERIVISVKRPIEVVDSDGELARKHCLTELFAALSAGAICHQVALAVMEQRKDQKHRNADAATIKAARASGRIDRNMHVVPLSPTIESLLWVPDVASFAVNHLYRGPEFNYVANFKHKITYVG